MRELRRWLRRFRRRHGPLIRYWDKDFNYISGHPVSVESWAAWALRQAKRVSRA